MTKKELIHAEIERLGEEYLDELLQLIKDFAAAKKPATKGGLMSKLRQIQIDAPADFVSNFDLYRWGEKRIEDDLP